jgi:hypothetical protein
VLPAGHVLQQEAPLVLLTGMLLRAGPALTGMRLCTAPVLTGMMSCSGSSLTVVCVRAGRVLQARDEKGSAAAIQEEMKDVPPLAQMVSEIKEEVFDDEDEALDAGGL